MLHTKTVDVRATTKQVEDRVTCDFCGATLKRRDEFDFDKVTIERSVGSIYPDAGHGVDTTIDCCPACWHARVLPTLRMMLVSGAEPRTTEWDY
jgi:hypothetical protein